MGILVINTGGTFNKIYDPIRGELTVSKSNRAIESILNTLPAYCDRVTVNGIIFKDSLEMNSKDREALFRMISEAKTDYIVVVHGTDTMDISAEYISDRVNDKKIVFTGAMVPFSIDEVEATANLASALTALPFVSNGVYISMQGHLLPYDKIRKNRDLGIFERVDSGNDSILNP